MATKKVGRAFVWVILGLLFVGLMGFGATSFSGTLRSVGTVGNLPVGANVYARTLTQQIRAFEAQIGTAVSFPQAQAIGLDQSVLNGLITQRVLDNEVARLGLSVGDSRVRDQVVAINAFAGLDGQFDRDAYRETLRSNNQTEAEFETGIREEMARTLLQVAVVSGIPATAAHGDTLIQYTAEQRDITWARVGHDMVTTDQPAATDADLQAYYDANPAAFTLPQTKDITYAWITPDMIRDSVTVAEEDLRALYDQRIADFVQPERRLVERLVFADDAQAQSAFDRLTAGDADFETLVADRGLNLADTDLGDVDAGQLGAAGDIVFAANPGDVVGPAPSSLGPALFRINAVLAAEEITFEDAQDDLRVELASERARRQIDASIDGVNDLIAGGATPEDIAERTDLELGTVSWSEGSTEGIAAYDGFRQAASATDAGDFPDLFTLEDGGIFVLRVDAVREPVLQPLADVRDAVLAGWQAQAQQEATLAFATELASQILPLTGFETLGLQPTKSNDLTRRAFLDNTPEGFTAAIFDMEPGDVRAIPTATGAIVVRLDAVQPPDLTEPTVQAERTAIGEQIAAGVAQDIFDIYASELRAQTDVSIDQAAVNAVNASFQ